MNKPKLLVFASGSKDGGGSGLLYLLLSIISGVLNADIVGIASNHENGGVRSIADKFKIPFYYFLEEFTAENYQRLAIDSGAEWFILSGWVKFVKGLPVEKTINIHPGCTINFGGAGMYGHHVHDATMEAYINGTVTCSYVSMHFVDDVYDNGKLFFRFPVGINKGDTPETLGSRVNEYEHGWQPFMTNMIVNEQIKLTGGTVYVPAWYKEEAFCPEECTA